MLRERVEIRDVFAVLAVGELRGAVGDQLAVRQSLLQVVCWEHTSPIREVPFLCRWIKAFGNDDLPLPEEGVLLAVGDHRSPPRARVARRGSK